MKTRMRHLTSCDKCDAPIWAEDVFKTVAIPQAVGHLALIFRCSNCHAQGKAAATRDQWEEAQEANEQRSHEREAVLAGARIDLGTVENVHDLQLEWATRPPIAESTMGSCKCVQCQRRLYEA